MRWMILVMLLSAATVYALDAVQVPNHDLKVTWLEPDTNANGTPLEDLDKIIIRGTINDVVFEDVEVQASGLTGGQLGEHIFSGVCSPNTSPVADLSLYAVDLVGNESEEAVIVKTIDCLPPGKVK